MQLGEGVFSKKAWEMWTVNKANLQINVNFSTLNEKEIY